MPRTEKGTTVIPCKIEQHKNFYIFWPDLALSQIVLNENDLGHWLRPNTVTILLLPLTRLCPVFDTNDGLNVMELVSSYLDFIPTIFGVIERSHPHFIGLIT